jgi:enamine deaminase RidA (YjgF/YER057c/UK114 family)
VSVWKCFRPTGIDHPAALTLANEDTIFVSGLSGHRADGSISEDPTEQARQAFRNIADLLEREGSGLDEVVWIHPYGTTIENALAITPAVTEAFGDAPPASAALLGNVALASPDMLIEIEAIAVRGARRELHQS